MKNDIDFDELDKAVGAVLNTGAAAKPSDDAKPQPVVPTTPAKPVSNSVEEAIPVAKATVSPEKPSTSKKPAKPASPALKRSSGRFMDMVHPSADMKKSNTPSVKRDGNKLQPISKDIKAEDSAPEPTSPAPAVMSKSDYEPGPPAADLAATGFVSMPDDDKAANAKSEWPDPLEVDKPTDGSPVEEPTMLASSESAVPEASQSADGPFLSDQKVEKRPLGAFALDGKSDEATAEPIQTETNPVVQPGETSSSPVPQELQPEAVKVEASDVPEPAEDDAPLSDKLGDTSLKSEASTTTTEQTKEHGKLDDASSKTDDNQAEPSSDTKSPVDTVNLSGQSIAPQYKPQATDNDSAEAASSVFDTKEYHQPLAPSAAKHGLKKVTSVIGLIILLVLIGAAIGYAYYVYRTGGF
ncbi:MAG TPA: hypothetical protein VFG56_02975 [Candidatus Saccharimonadales bacterium]|nr:hypothetical protein [Candidatus Saccharimonadales bacterium]